MEIRNSVSKSVDLPSVEDIIAVCEFRLRKYLKKKQIERRLVAAQGYDFCDHSNISNYNVFIDYYEDPDDSIATSVRREKTIDGSWLFLSFMSGGWSYDTTKRFIIREYGVKYIRNRHIAKWLAADEEFKAVVKFRSSEELNRVVMSLQRKNIHSKFLFFSFDKIPITFYDSDSD